MTALRATDAAPLVEGCVTGEPVADDESRSDLPLSLWEAHRQLIADRLNRELGHLLPGDCRLAWEEVPISGSRTPDTGR